MMLHHQPGSQMLARKLANIGDLWAEDEAAIASLEMSLVNVAEGHVIAAEGSNPRHCCLIISGLACRYKILVDGKRQIMSFHTPGDFPDFYSLHVDVMDHSLAAAAPCQLGLVPHSTFRNWVRQHPHLANLLWRDTLIDGSMFREWIVNVGRRTGLRRISHLLCELAVRLESVGLVDQSRFSFPLTQSDLSDAVGLSVVHVNRVLQELKSQNIVLLQNREAIVLDWHKLRGIAQFDGSYLHLKDGGRSLRYFRLH
ncbi:Crp/Fnr family transcriptional regulator [Aureimonas fodinaquatilis]|uniref:Crp/Fnr family transcriptional regulator n=1 Tax=Aureimonas fodinaquatilis TaxID=2565783 RepID=A0A5B0DUY8_9HYPH|nr:Crp/Fnr family transcriptional regulator [Aureimonas fodinaquatilis]KAA0970627.1 Crp/Fnr family transcriptional regulator [Aureimonas fodinaquatilis]